jgi:hypothetical protein
MRSCLSWLKRSRRWFLRTLMLNMIKMSCSTFTLWTLWIFAWFRRLPDLIFCLIKSTVHWKI